MGSTAMGVVLPRKCPGDISMANQRWTGAFLVARGRRALLPGLASAGILIATAKVHLCADRGVTLAAAREDLVSESGLGSILLHAHAHGCAGLWRLAGRDAHLARGRSATLCGQLQGI